jgi:hypothetical protein
MLFLTRCGRGQAVFEAQLGAELVERGRARRGALAQAEEAVGELFFVVRENGADADRAGALQVAQTAPSWRHGQQVALAGDEGDEGLV